MKAKIKLKDQAVNLRLTKESVNGVRLWAEEQNLTISQLMRQILLEWMVARSHERLESTSRDFYLFKFSDEVGNVIHVKRVARDPKDSKKKRKARAAVHEP